MAEKAKESRRRKIAILTPVQRGVEADFTASILRTMTTVPADVLWFNVVGHANLPRARNILVGKALAHGVDDIVFIDSDIGWEPEAFSALFKVPDDVGVVAGAPQRRDHTGVSFCASTKPGKTRIHGDLIEGYAATAFLRVRREVFEILAPKCPEFEYDGEIYRAFFNYRIAPNPSRDAIGFIGEDFHFCMVCQENDVSVWIHPKIALRHWHSSPLTEVFGDFVKVKPDSVAPEKEVENA